MPPRKVQKARPGPEPEILKIEGNWRNAVRGALKKGKPPATKATKKKKGPRRKG
ncbi:MAG: hypothetical protein ABR499_21120 [Gemmatimonadaceae bacterium]